MSTHVDDLAMAATVAIAEQLWQGLEERMQLKRGPIFDRQWRGFLGREWRCSEHGFEVRMPTNYWTTLLEMFDLTNCRSVANPQWQGDEAEDNAEVSAYECGLN